VLILGYHRIAESDADPYGLCVRPQYFAEHLDVIRRRTNPISLAEAVDGLRSGRSPDRSVVLTFDDGYVDALTAAKPILEKAGIPATFFVVTGNPGGVFWWDELDMIAQEISKHSGARLDGIIPAAWVEEVNSAPFGPGSHLDRLRKLYRYMLKRPAERRKVLDALRSRFGDGAGKLDPSRRCLTANEIRTLAETGGFEIGSHSVSHTRLTDIGNSEQEREVFGSTAFLESLLGRPVRFFSYPNGAFAPSIEPILRAASLEAACVSRLGVADSHSNPYRLPRLWVRNTGGSSFEQRLMRWLPRSRGIH
jgi:peptidoglycan/xylan/chitin deacetylase (PgdA/CDA1 family)